MIRSLYIKDIYLFEEEEIFFQKGLNIITGETGSGKTTILNTISLILGSKANLKSLKNEKAIIEANFQIENFSIIKSILQKVDLDLSTTEITIRREIFKNGKNRCFINDELITLTTLKTIGIHLLEIVSQNANQDLLSKRNQLKFLDLFANLDRDVKSFSKSFKKFNLLEKSLKELIDQKNVQLQKKQNFSTELKEIEEIDLKKDEEENISKEHTLIVNSHDILEKLNLIYFSLIESQSPIIPLLKTFETDLEKLSGIDEKLKQSYDHLKSSSLELEEAVNLILNFKSKLEIDPNRLEEIENRIAQIHTLEKKYGSFEGIERHKQKIQDELDSLQNIDSSISSTRDEIEKLQSQVDKKALYISEERSKYAKTFKTKVLSILKDLNMQAALFDIDIKKDLRTSIGDDLVTFLFSANKGEKLSPIKSIASGGELSRLMLSIKKTLSEKDNLSIIFDEIDSNVGGTSASLIGQKLKELSNFRQIICITHFVQVAKIADTHLVIYKEERNNNTFSKIKTLSNDCKKIEYDRMIGLNH